MLLLIVLINNIHLRREFGKVNKKINTDKRLVNQEEEKTSVKIFLAFRVVLLDKNPHLNSTGVGEVL